MIIEIKCKSRFILINKKNICFSELFFFEPDGLDRITVLKIDFNNQKTICFSTENNHDYFLDIETINQVYRFIAE